MHHLIITYVYIYIFILNYIVYIYIYIYMVSCPVLTVPGGVGTRIRYTHCISTLCRLSTLPQYYKPPPHHRGGETYTLPQYHKPPPHHRGGNPLLPPPINGEGGGTGQHCTIGGEGGGGPANTAPYIYIYIYIYICMILVQSAHFFLDFKKRGELPPFKVVQRRLQMAPWNFKKSSFATSVAPLGLAQAVSSSKAAGTPPVCRRFSEGKKGKTFFPTFNIFQTYL